LGEGEWVNETKRRAFDIVYVCDRRRENIIAKHCSPDVGEILTLIRREGGLGVVRKDRIARE
jgi:hypothetical protein